MKVLIIEDESPAARRLQKRIEELETSAEIIAVLDSVGDSVEWLKNNSAPDIIFCDVELSDGLSFEIFSKVEVAVPVIFTTAYDEYALRAFRVNSVDYLLKPVDASALEQAFDKWRKHHQTAGTVVNGSAPDEAEATPHSGPANLADRLDQLMKSIQAPHREYKQRFLIKTGLNWISLHVDQIAWFTTEDKVVLLSDFDGNRYPLSHSLDDLDGMLDPAAFFRVNRQYIVSWSAVRSAQSYFNGKLKLRIQPPVEDGVIVSRDRAGAFKEWLDR